MQKLEIAGTGHRPQFCPCKFDDSHPWLINLKKRLTDYLIEMQYGDTKVIVRAGGAIGWDTWLAQVALEMDLDLHLYLPFPDQANRWPTKTREEYERIKSDADEIFFTADEYHQRVFLDRDDQMIAGADKVVALLNPEAKSGGTYYTVQKAKEQFIDTVNFFNPR